MTIIIATPTAMYADSQCTSAMSNFNVSKLQHVKSAKDKTDYLVGGAGELDQVLLLMRLLGEYSLSGLWKLHLTDNWPPAILKDDESQLVIVTRDERIWSMSCGLLPIQVMEPTHIIGSGGQYAIAAMALGKTPEESIGLTCRLDAGSGLPVRKLTFPPKPTRRKR